MEPFSQNTPAIDLITSNQSAFENTSSSFAGNKLTGLSIDTLGNQDIAKVELEIYLSDVHRKRFTFCVRFNGDLDRSKSD